MRFFPAFLAAAFALASTADAAESSAADADAPLSPIRQFLRDSIKAPLLAKPAESSVKPVAKSPDEPVILPAVHITERSLLQVVDRVDAAFEQKARLQSHALYTTDRLDILQPPTLEPGPAGMPRLRLNILQLKF